MKNGNKRLSKEKPTKITQTINVPDVYECMFRYWYIFVKQNEQKKIIFFSPNVLISDEYVVNLLSIVSAQVGFYSVKTLVVGR